MNWKGVMPAITTCFDENLKVDHDLMVKHYLWLLENGCSGIVLLGSGVSGKGLCRRGLRRIDGPAALCLSR